MTNKVMSKKQVLEAVERMFAPDLMVRVGKENEITSYHAATKAGALFLSAHSLLGMDYDKALTLSNGLCFEIYE